MEINLEISSTSRLTNRVVEFFSNFGLIGSVFIMLAIPVGWIINLVKLGKLIFAVAPGASIESVVNAEFLIRVLGVFIGLLGTVLGWFWW